MFYIYIIKKKNQINIDSSFEKCQYTLCSKESKEPVYFFFFLNGFFNSIKYFVLLYLYIYVYKNTGIGSSGQHLNLFVQLGSSSSVASLQNFQKVLRVYSPKKSFISSQSTICLTFESLLIRFWQIKKKKKPRTNQNPFTTETFDVFFLNCFIIYLIV